MTTNLLTIFFCLICLTGFAQESYLPKISKQDFGTTSQLIDSTAHAIVLYEKGRSDIQVIESDRGLRVIHEYSVRIKILDREGFDEANQTIPLYRIGGDFEYMRNIRATTHNMENGAISSQEVDKKAIFSEKVNEYVNLTKFTLPNIRENSIIDIEYTLYSPDIFNYRTWEFQADIPKIYSEYTAVIPAVYQYGVTLRGPYSLSRDVKGEVLKSHFLLAGRRFDCSKLLYVMENIPAFKEESHMLAAKNYKSAMYFELEEYYSTTGAKHQITKEWKNVDRELLNDKNFGKQITRENAFKDILPSITANLSSGEDKARAIYSYIKKNIRWNKYYGKYSQYGIKDLLEQRSGNAGDINLALVAAMNAANLECYPIIISTRENGLPNSIHPVISDFNYVIAGLKINNKIHFLDATERHLPFGELPLRCINGSGRIIYSRKSSEWIELQNARPSQISYSVHGKIDKDGQFDGEINISYTGIEALYRRNHISSFLSPEDYISDRIQKTSGFKIKDGSVENLEDVEKDLTETLQVSIDFSHYMRNQTFSLNPILVGTVSKNPFNLEERTYPVDMGAKRIENYLASIELPDGYTIEDSPKNIKLALPENTAQYLYHTSFDHNKLELRQALLLNKAIYSVDEYFHLKEFYSRIIQHQKIDFLFTKSL